jgi:hypothetical protein
MISFRRHLCAGAIEEIRHNRWKGVDMNNCRALSSVFAVFFLAAACAACADDAPENHGDDMPAPTLEAMDGPAGTNGMLPLCFWDHSTQSALRTLGTTTLVDSTGKLRSMALPIGCGDVVDYVVKCALPHGDSVTDGGNDTHEGLYGLAPSWKTAPLDTASQRWMTACMLEHLNGLGQHWSIMLTGNHTSLAPIPDQDTTSYDLDESAAFGNLFTGKWSLLAPAFTAYVCTEQPLLDTCTLGSTVLSARFCDLAPLCGVKILGQCKNVCQLDSNGSWKCPAHGYSEVIRVSMKSDDVLLLCQ